MTAPAVADRGWPTSACTSRTCGAVIIRARTEKGNTMPVDYAPSSAGTFELIPTSERKPLARYVKPADRGGREDLYVSHYATCDRPADFRRRR